MQLRGGRHSIAQDNWLCSGEPGRTGGSWTGPMRLILTDGRNNSMALEWIDIDPEQGQPDSSCF